MLRTLIDAVLGRDGLAEVLRVLRAPDASDAARSEALRQMAAEFGAGRGRFDRIMDGVNRLPRPLLALGVIGLFVSAMVDPDWFAARMVGLAAVPEPLWWLLGVIVSFYFGARHQAKAQAWGRSLAAILARRPAASENPALEEWRRG